MDAQTIKYYDDNAAEKAALYDTADMSWMYADLQMLLPPSATILEIGCGNGRDARALASLGFKVTATDASMKMLDEAKSRTHHGQVEYIHAAFPLAANSPLFSHKFDAVLAVAVLMHIPVNERPLFFSQISSLLTDVGILYCSYTNRSTTDARLFAVTDKAELFRQLSKAGLTLAKSIANTDSLSRPIEWETVVALK